MATRSGGRSGRGLCAVLLAAGEGRRLRPLTETRPKALCPVGNVALLDRALAAVAGLGLAGPDRVAVNAWHLAASIVAHVGVRAHVSVETGPAPLGSAGGVAALRDWIDGRDVLVGNADAYLTGGDLRPLLAASDTGPGPGSAITRPGADGRASARSGRGGDRHDVVRMLGVPAGDRPAEFGGYRFAGFSLIPWRLVAALPIRQDDLVFAVWRPAERAGALRVIDYGGAYIDCGTPADYLAANLDAAARAGGSIVAPDAVVTGHIGQAVIGAGAHVAGRVEHTVVWPGAAVAAGEALSHAIRYGPEGTIQVGAGSVTTDPASADPASAGSHG